MVDFDDVNVYNLGVCGQSSDDLLRRFEREATVRESEMILIAIGINDSQYLETKEHPRVSLDQFKSNLTELIGISRKMTDNIIFVGLTKVDESKTMPVAWDVETFYDNENIESYDAIIRRLCEESGSMYIDMKDIVDATGLEDGLHPTSVGHEKIYKTVLHRVSKLLNK
jgi:lysophospholipase L1-like esterase